MTFIRPTYLVLPRAISTNNLFRNVAGKGRVVTGDYAKWKRLAAEYLQAQTPLPRFTAPVEITLYSGEAGVGNMDASNTLKAVEDALVQAKVITDDSRKHVRSSRAVWVPHLKASVVEIVAARPSPLVTTILQRVPEHMHQFLR